MRTDKSSRHLICPDADGPQPFRVRVRIREVSASIKGRPEMQTGGCRRTLARFVDRFDRTGRDIAALTVARGRRIRRDRRSRRDGCEVGGWRGRAGRCWLIGCVFLTRFRFRFGSWHGVERLQAHRYQGAPCWTQRLVSGPAIAPAAYRALAHPDKRGKLLLLHAARF